MIFWVISIILLPYSIFGIDFNIFHKAPNGFRAFDYSNLFLEIETKEGITIAGILPPEDEKIIIKPSSNSLISKEEGGAIAKFDFIVLPKERGNFNLKPFKILYFEGQPRDEEPKIYEYKIAKIEVKGRYFYKNLYFWYIIGIIFLISVIIFLFYLRRFYGKGNSSSQGKT